jgi:flagellar protein FliO/FliZ
MKQIKYVGLSVLVLLLFWCGGAGAVDSIEDLNRELDKTTPQTTETAAPGGATGQTAEDGVSVLPTVAGSLFRIVIVLVVLVVVIWGVAKVFQNKFTHRVQGKWLQVVDEVTLGNNRGILLCQLGEQVFTLGVTDHQVTFLFSVEDEELLQGVAREGAADSLPEEDFLVPPSGIGRLFSRPGKKRTRSFHALLQDSLDRIKPLIHSNEREENDHAENGS